MFEAPCKKPAIGVNSINDGQLPFFDLMSNPRKYGEKADGGSLKNVNSSMQ